MEDDDRERDTLKQGLGRHGHEVTEASTGEQALADHDDADLILLDLELPDLDGLEVCRAIRVDRDTPIIVVTERASELDCVLALQNGADDYIVKPYGFQELLARIEAVMRRARSGAPVAEVIEHGPLQINTNTREVTCHGKRIRTTRKEFDLLSLLASRPDSVVSRKFIMHQIWGDSWSRRTVDTHVSSLRNKLGGSEWIVAVRGVGFRIGPA